MNTKCTCSSCGAELPADAPSGLCGPCLLRNALPVDEPTSATSAPPGTILITATMAAGEQPGDRIGRYKLLQEIGEGGMGTVWMAEQEEPVRRRIALKVIKLGMDTKQVVGRFEAERQALAMMDHPNIAKVFDAGATDNGRPFFVMELVKGIPITKYCDDNKLGTKERLELFIEVCRAIQHAHQKGIIHRDIKPSNILVTNHDGTPVPKVIDFGIAKATDHKLTDKTVFTAFEQFIGTPAYMSPEQAEMNALDIDTRTDVYSLGVLLYELLTGKTPFDAKELISAGLEGMRKMIREKEPARPSTRISSLDNAEQTTVANQRHSEPPKLLHLVRGDLDWVAMKCLEKDRTRRYETANGLAADVERHLKTEPVVARPPSNLYRFQKLVRRNKLAFGAAAAIATLLVFGILVSTWLALRATRAQAGEAKERAVAEQRLYDSLLSEARATRAARRVGYRDEVFALVKQASALNVSKKDLTDLRRAAVACLGDFVGLTPTTFTDFPINTSIRLTRLDPSGQLAAFLLSDGMIQLRRLPSGAIIARLKSSPQSMPRSMCFNATGDQLISVHAPAEQLPQGAVPETQFHVWARGADGRWGEAENIGIPEALECLSSVKGLFVTAFDLNPRSGMLVDLKTKAVVQRFDFPEQGYPIVALSPDGQLLAAESVEASEVENSVIDLWDLKTGKRMDRLKPRLGSFVSLNFDPDGKYVSCLTMRGGAIYTVGGSQRNADFKEYFDSPSQASFAPGNNVVGLPIHQQNRVRLWDWVRNEDVAVLEEPEPVFETAFASDGSFLLTSGKRHARLYVLDLTAENLRLAGHATGVPGVVFSPDGTQIASVSGDQTKVWDAVTGRKTWETPVIPGQGQAVAYSPDGQFLAAGNFQANDVWVWNARTGKRMLELGTNTFGRIWSVRFSPDGRYLATASTSHIKVWKIERHPSGEAEGSFDAKLLKSLAGYFRSLVFAPDCKHLAFVNLATDASRGLYVWEIDGPTAPRLVSANLLGGIGSANCVNFTPDSRELLTVGPERVVMTLDVEMGREILSFPTIGPKYNRQGIFGTHLSLSPDGTKLAMDSTSSTGVDIWELKSRQFLYSLPEERSTVYWMAWSPDSHRLAVSRSNGDIAIWNLMESERILTELGLNGPEAKTVNKSKAGVTSDYLQVKSANKIPMKTLGLANPPAVDDPEALVPAGLSTNHHEHAYLTALDEKSLSKSSLFTNATGKPIIGDEEVFGEKYIYAGGYFGKVTNGTVWKELAADGVFNFEELKRDGEMILLRDASRKIQIQIPVKAGMSKLSADDGETWGDLYEVRKE